MNDELDSAVNHEHPESIAERFKDGYMYPNLEHDAERLANGYLDLARRVQELQEALDKLTEGFALTITERVERTHDEFQRLGLVEGRDDRDSEAGRKCLGSMATDAVYFAALVRDVRAMQRGTQ